MTWTAAAAEAAVRIQVRLAGPAVRLRVGLGTRAQLLSLWLAADSESDDHRDHDNSDAIMMMTRIMI